MFERRRGRRGRGGGEGGNSEVWLKQPQSDDGNAETRTDVPSCTPGGRASEGRAVFPSEPTGEGGKGINGMKLSANKDIEGRDAQAPLLSVA